MAARHPAARPGVAPALKALDLRVGRGEQVAVIGPSGAGKTTLLQVLACAHAAGRGRGSRWTARTPGRCRGATLQRLRGRLFLAPQVPPLPPRQRVVTAVLAGRLPAMGLCASLRSLFYPSDIPAAHDALDRFDLADKLFERVDRLSGGERQRVGLARALLAPASLWLVDEPLSALDPARSRQAIATLVDGRPSAASRWWPPAPGGRGAGALPAHRGPARRRAGLRPAGGAGDARAPGAAVRRSTNTSCAATRPAPPRTRRRQRRSRW